ncbi:MAG TPA: hypothetical protein VM864_12655 [Pyrinomonadaceae bacterium]|nr:hypothetical protein [Pyrinomonadaceae bacterium]
MSSLRTKASSSRGKWLSIVASLCLLAVPCVAAAVSALDDGRNDRGAQQAAKQENAQGAEREERARRERQKEGGKESAERERKNELAAAERLDQSRLAREAKITMEQALQFATGHQPGIALESRLGRERDEVAYKVLILDRDATEGQITLLIISGLDGRVLKTERGVIK